MKERTYQGKTWSEMSDRDIHLWQLERYADLTRRKYTKKEILKQDIKFIIFRILFNHKFGVKLLTTYYKIKNFLLMK